MGLDTFEGHDVLTSGVEMPGASGGLNKALAVNELELHHGDKGVLAIEFEVVKVRFDRLGETDVLQRVHVLKVTNAVPITGEAVEADLEQQRIRQEEAAGVKRLEFEGDEDAPDEPGD